MSELIGFENFRSSEKEILIDLLKITILTGPNSSGKSSLIKAAKLLKQNINTKPLTGLPGRLSFVPDELGHNLSSFRNIINRSSQLQDISFIIPIDLPTLGKDFYGKITYELIQSGHTELNGLKSITVYKASNVPVQLFKLKGEADNFTEFELNPVLFQECLEESFLIFLQKTKELKIGSQTLTFESGRQNIPVSESLENFMIYADRFYSFEKPVMPWFTLFEDGKLADEVKAHDGLHTFRKYFLEEIDEYAKKHNIGDKHIAIHHYFVDLENHFFSFINNSRLSFGIDLIYQSSPSWFEGIRLDFKVDDAIKIPEETIRMIGEFDARIRTLMEVYEALNPIEIGSTCDPSNPNNNDIFTNYINYIGLACIEKCRFYIENFNFADLNRIEQVMLYSNSGSYTAFRIINDYLKSDSWKTNEISTFLRRFNIADDFKIDQTNGVYSISLLKGDNWVSLSELGFGISKIFFCLLALDTYQMVFLEEPESNLHPDYQSKLADIIQSFAKEQRRLVIETHSEYFIRKLQYLVATNKLNKDDVIIYYFNSITDKNKNKPVKAIGIKRDGSLDGEFGKGFFDEASNIIRDLFNLTVYN